MRQLANRMLEGKNRRERFAICNTAPKGLLRKYLLEQNKLLNAIASRRL